MSAKRSPRAKPEVPEEDVVRLRSLAQPLIATLSDEQKQAGRTALSSMGVSF